MSHLNRWVSFIVDTCHAVKKENINWKQQYQSLEQAEILAEKKLEAELKKRSVQLAHEISLLKTEHASQLARLKIKCQQDVNDYKHYLKSLDQLKKSLQKKHTHLPEALVFTIHHHAKQLLNQMWETQNIQDKMQLEMQLINFMTTVNEESRLFLKSETPDELPHKTLALIKANAD